MHTTLRQISTKWGASGDCAGPKGTSTIGMQSCAYVFTLHPKHKQYMNIEIQKLRSNIDLTGQTIVV